MKAGVVMKSVSILCAVLACAGCASSESELICDPPCQEREECIDGECIPPECCPNAPAGEFHIAVRGKVYDITTMQGVRASIDYIRPMDALTNPEPPCISCGRWRESDENGNFELSCVDVTEVAIGLVVVVDDPLSIPGQDLYFYSASGAKSWSTNADKVCEYNAKAYAVPNTLVAALDANTSVDSAGFGFVLGVVTDTDGNWVEGAVIKKGDGTNLVEVIYPNADFSTFDGTATSTYGFFVLPHTNFATGITAIVAEKEGMTFGAEQAAPKAGFCYVVIINS
jgi:hypothetical protein